jgi:hypothetical protein
MLRSLVRREAEGTRNLTVFVSKWGLVIKRSVCSLLTTLKLAGLHDHRSLEAFIVATCSPFAVLVPKSHDMDSKVRIPCPYLLVGTETRLPHSYLFQKAYDEEMSSIKLMPTLSESTKANLNLKQLLPKLYTLGSMELTR